MFQNNQLSILLSDLLKIQMINAHPKNQQANVSWHVMCIICEGFFPLKFDSIAHNQNYLFYYGWAEINRIFQINSHNMNTISIRKIDIHTTVCLTENSEQKKPQILMQIYRQS